MQDDAELLYAPPRRISKAFDRLEAAGVRAVRLTAGWSVLAPRPRASRRPRFDARDPAEYDARGWARLDRAVRAAHRRGMAAMIDIGFWAPVWATDRDRSHHPRRYVDPLHLARFAQAVAQRYDGDYDPAGVAGRLPAVRTFTIWNEPNMPEFLGPQWRGPVAAGVPVSPHLYRRMVAAAYPAIKSVQPDAVVLVGGLAGYGRRGVPPLRFMRELACVDEGLSPLPRRECRDFERVPGDGLAYHPYSTHTEPDQVERTASADDAPLARLRQLGRLLDALAVAGRIDAGLRDIYVTEYGYETRPPDPGAAFAPARAARMWSWAEAIAARVPRVRTVAQFLVRDLPGAGGAGARHEGQLSDWQSGLLFRDGRPKPLAAVLPAPLHAELAGDGRVRLWGRVRTGDGRRPVRIEGIEPGRRPRVIFEGETDDRGIVRHTLRAEPRTLFRIARRVGERWVPGPPVDVLAARG